MLGRDSYKTGRVARALSGSHQSPTSCPSGKLCRIIINQQCDIISETPCSCAELCTKDLNNPPAECLNFHKLQQLIYYATLNCRVSKTREGRTLFPQVVRRSASSVVVADHLVAMHAVVRVAHGLGDGRSNRCSVPSRVGNHVRFALFMPEAVAGGTTAAGVIGAAQEPDGLDMMTEAPLLEARQRCLSKQ